MPKVIGTRKQKAKELLRWVEDGPCIRHEGWTPAQEAKIKKQYDLWSTLDHSQD